MSFSSEQKQEIISHQYKSSCCRRALLYGYLFSRAEVIQGDTLQVKAEKDVYINFISRLAKEFFGKELSPQRKKTGGRFLYATFESHSAKKYLEEIKSDVILYPQKCANCESAFLRGVFLGAGRITDPNKQFCLEFYLGERTELLYNYLVDAGVVPLISNKESGKVLYYKSSAKIKDFSALASFNKTLFTILDAEIARDSRNRANRLVNCETNNIDKSVKASAKHLQVIEELEKKNLLSSLPEELEKTARLRMQYPDYSLSQLSKIIVPPVSKSGLSHRLNKIVELSSNLLKKI